MIRIHRAHCQPGAIDQTADVAVELHVAEPRLAGADFGRLLLGQIAQLAEILVAKHRVVVERHLGVERQQFARLSDDQRIDFHQAAIAIDEHATHGLHELFGRADARAGELELRGELARLIAEQAGVGIKWLAEDQLRGLGRHFLDVHPPFARHHEHGAGRGAIDNDAQVEFARDFAAFLNQHLANRLAGGTGLNGLEVIAQNGRGDLLRLGPLRTSCTPCCEGFSLIVPLPRPPA